MIILVATILNAQDSANISLRWAIAGQAADLVSTEISLANGGVEMNPLMQNRSVRIAAKVGLVVVFHAYAKKYPEDRLGIIILAIVSWLPVFNNIIQLTR